MMKEEVGWILFGTFLMLFGMLIEYYWKPITKWNKAIDKQQWKIMQKDYERNKK